ncbi:putative non-specific serine/threonine protein kinase [Helianthus anomalus]
MVRKNNFASDKKKEDWELPLFDFNTIANATNNFSDDCKLGEGGFGPVYMVILLLIRWVWVGLKRAIFRTY